jgi:hypothetical protein
MPETLSPAEQAVLEEQLVPAFRGILGDATLPADPAEVELLAATILMPLELPGIRPAVTDVFIREIERSGDQRAAGVLAALAVLATGDMAAAARAGVERLERAGVTSPLLGKLGTAAVTEAARLASHEDDAAELLVALLGRPRARRLQVAVLGVEHAETGGALVECMLSPPMPAAEARALLEATTPDGAAAEPIAVDVLVSCAVAAARRAVELGIPLGHEAAVAMPIVSRALTGDPAGLARPETIPPWEDDDPELVVDAAEDEDGCAAVTSGLLDELAAWAQEACPADGPVFRNGDFVASAMLDWKGGYDDGRLGRWTQDNLAEFLLGWFPRKASCDDETLGDVVDCVIAFLHFLDDRDSLSGEPLEVLAEACDELRDEFLDCATDPTSWGLAKSMFMQMRKEGVDPENSAAVERWMADFNDRPRDERDAIVGGAADRMLAAAGGAPGRRGAPGRPKQARKRKSQRAARKRNRRR